MRPHGSPKELEQRRQHASLRLQPDKERDSSLLPISEGRCLRTSCGASRADTDMPLKEMNRNRMQG